MTWPEAIPGACGTCPAADACGEPRPPRSDCPYCTDETFFPHYLITTFVLKPLNQMMHVLLFRCFESSKASKGRHLFLKILVALMLLVAILSPFPQLVPGTDWASRFYFLLTTLSTVGYGDITPKTTLQKLVASGVMLPQILVLVFTIKEIFEGDGGR